MNLRICPAPKACAVGLALALGSLVSSCLAAVPIQKHVYFGAPSRRSEFPAFAGVVPRETLTHRQFPCAFGVPSSPASGTFIINPTVRRAPSCPRARMLKNAVCGNKQHGQRNFRVPSLRAESRAGGKAAELANAKSRELMDKAASKVQAWLEEVYEAVDYEAALIRAGVLEDMDLNAVEEDQGDEENIEDSNLISIAVSQASLHAEPGWLAETLNTARKGNMSHARMHASCPAAKSLTHPFTRTHTHALAHVRASAVRRGISANGS